MTEPTDTPAPVEPRHREAARCIFNSHYQYPRVMNHAIEVIEQIAEGLAQGEQEGRREERARPGLVGFVIDLSNQPCRQEAEGSSPDFPCDQTNACVTEWCDPCHARLVLRGDHLQESDET